MSNSFEQNQGDNQGSQDASAEQGSFSESSTQETPKQESTPVTAEQLSLKVGDRTFSSQEDLANHIQHAQTHISRLEQENADMRAKMAEFDTLKEQVNELLEEVRKPKESTSEGESSMTSTIDTEALVGQVKESLQKEQTKAVQEANFEKAKAAAQEAWGDTYLQKIAERAKDLDMPLKEVDRLAKQSPKAFSRIILEDSGTPKGDGTDIPRPSTRVTLPGDQNGQEKPKTRFSRMNTMDRAAEVARRIEALSNN